MHQFIAAFCAGLLYFATVVMEVASPGKVFIPKGPSAA